MVNFTNRSINNNNNNNESNNRVASRNVKSSTVAEEKMKKPSEFDGANRTMTGRNTFAFWTIVWLIFVLAVGNLCLTLTIFGVLRIGKGMDSLEVRDLWQFNFISFEE